MQRVCGAPSKLLPMNVAVRYASSSSNTKRNQQRKRNGPKYVDPNYPKRPLNGIYLFKCDQYFCGLQFYIRLDTQLI